MKLELSNTKSSKEIQMLFTATFTNSESAKEGKTIGNLVHGLITKTKHEERYTFTATENEQIIACVIFTKLNTPSNANAYILSPMAVHPNHQNKGIGQKIIHFGINHLKQNQIEWLLTYGDQNFYTKLGFEQISPDVIIPPYKLSYPEGWLGQSLTNRPLPQTSIECVTPLSNPQYW